MKEDKYFIFEDCKNETRFIAKDYKHLNYILKNNGHKISEKHQRHRFNQIGYIYANDLTIELFMETKQVISLVEEYLKQHIEKQIPKNDRLS